MRIRPLLAVIAALGLVAGACSSDSSRATERAESSESPADAEAPDDDADAATETPGPPEGARATFTVQSSTEQLIVTDAEAGQPLTIHSADGRVAAEGDADDLGQLVVRELEPAEGYVVASGQGDALATSTPTEVWSVQRAPDAELYESQVLEPGFGYVETRDGTLLAVNISLPGPVEDGPYPTVIEYSGYDPANPDAPQPSTLAAGVLGFATVGVNVRGTGCSGGAFLFSEPPQSTDGYDVVEAVAAQPWVEHGEVGMVGLSYPGIMQLFAAQTAPPHLAAIAPLSVIADTYRSTLRPGGILNDGFAISWAQERESDAQPGGQAWAQKRIDEGDDVCNANQEMRRQNADMFEIIADHPYYDDLFATVAPFEFVDAIDVPVFLAGAWQDEQTGGHFPNLLDRFDAAPVTRFTLTNGGHTEPLGPEIFSRWSEFLDLYVRRDVPRVSDAAPLIAATVGGAVFQTEVSLPPGRFDDVATYDEALARYEAELPVRVLFENGAGAAPGVPAPSFEASFSSWPIPEVAPRQWFLDSDGVLTGEPSDAESVDSFMYDVSRSHTTTLPEGSPWAALPAWSWEPPAEGTAVAYETEPLTETLVMAGHGRIDLGFASTADDVDVQVVLTEVRPDGQEIYVQGGWLRASHRALEPEQTNALRPMHSHLEADAEPLTPGEVTELNVELFPFAHVFRPGSSIRIIVSAPGGVRPEWTFDALDPGPDVQNSISVGGGVSSITLPVIPDLATAAPAELPACPALRGQPCRDYAALENRS